MKQDLYEKIVAYIVEHQAQFYRILVNESLRILKERGQDGSGRPGEHGNSLRGEGI